MPDNTATSKAATGRLRVELPHWTAEVRVFDNLYRPVEALGPVHRDPGGRYVAEAELSPGVYAVDVTMEGRTERKWFPVWAGKPTTVPLDEWSHKGIAATAPIVGSTTSRESHMYPAAEWSRKDTRGPIGDGASRLFVFVRTLEPSRFPRFADSLRILGPDDRRITDFRDGVQRSAESGWAVFSADVPAGAYVIRRGRKGVRVRHQPLFLCAGWETHVFLVGNTAPDLRRMSLGMTRKGTGFRPGDETAVAADAVLDSLRRAKGSRGVVSHEHLRELLSGKFENPWLGILALTAIERAARGVADEPELDRIAELRRRYAHVLTFLADAVPDHPDRLALDLDMQAEARAPFPAPPLLRANLDRVRAHADRFMGTVPEDSLTDRVLDQVLRDSPWTAWGILVPTVSARTARVGPSPTTVAADLELWAPPKTPAFLVEKQSAPEHVAVSLPGVALRDMPLLEVSGFLLSSRHFDDLPEREEFDGRQRIAQLVSRIDPVQASRTLGVPRSRIQRGLEQLDQVVEAARWGGKARVSPALRTVRDDLMQMALAASMGRSRNDPGGAVSSTSDDSIEEVVAAVRAEANRILVWSRGASESSAGMDVGLVRALALRLHRAADRLLERALFTVVTSADGGITYGNGAFLALLDRGVPPERAVEAPTHEDAPGRRAQDERRARWEKALRAAPAGRSEFPDPDGREDYSWELQRTLLVERGGAAESASLNAFRLRGSQPVEPETLRAAEQLISELRRQAALISHGSTGSARKAEQQLDSVVTRMEAALGAPGRPEI